MNQKKKIFLISILMILILAAIISIIATVSANKKNDTTDKSDEAIITITEPLSTPIQSSSTYVSSKPVSSKPVSSKPVSSVTPTSSNKSSHQSIIASSKEQISSVTVSSAPPPPTSPIKPYHHRSLLNSEEIIAYDEVLEAVKNGLSGVEITSAIAGDSITKLSRSIVFDNPELFYFSHINRYHWRDYNKSSVAYVEFSYYPEFADNLEYHKTKFNAAIDKIVVDASKKSTYYDMVVSVHHSISDLTAFINPSPLDQSAYSAVILGKSVCAGYSKATMVALNRLGIETGLVQGTTKNGSHLWNLVKMDGVYYNLDINWDDAGRPVGKYGNKFILIGDNDPVMITHVRDEYSKTAFPPCENNYK